MINIHRVKAISLDLDDTLWSAALATKKAEQALLFWLKSWAPRAAERLENFPGILADLRAGADKLRPDLRGNLSGLRRESIRALLSLEHEDLGLVEPAFKVFF